MQSIARKAGNIVWLRKAFSEAKANNSRGLALLGKPIQTSKIIGQLVRKTPTCA